MTYWEKPKRKSNLKIVERKCCSTEVINKFLNLALRSQTLDNIIETFQTIYHVD